MTTTQTTTKPLADRYREAMRDLRRAGFCVRNNIKKCCRSCVNESDFPTWDEKASQPLLWTFGGQGSAVTIYGDTAYGPAYPVERQYINHDNLDAEVWEIAKAIYDQHGIHVEWNGEQHQCITLDYTKSVDQKES